MLERNPQGRTIEHLKARLKCEIRLPATWQEERSPHGALPSRLDDRRRFPRFHYRVRAILQCQKTIPALSRPYNLYLVHTKDISRGGLGFLHSEELFPRERIRISLPGGEAHDLQVVHCRYLQQQCYEIGCRYLAELDAAFVRALVQHH